MRVERIQIPLKRAAIGQPAKRHLNGGSLAGRWWHNNNIECLLGSCVFIPGTQTSIDKEPYSFVIFQGGPNPMSPSGSAHVSCLSLILKTRWLICLVIWSYDRKASNREMLFFYPRLDRRVLLQKALR